MTFTSYSNYFQFEYESLITRCGGIVTGHSGFIESPNYGSNYYENSVCAWTIYVNKGSAVKIVITDLDLRDQSPCFNDYVEFFDGPDDKSNLLGKYCSDHPLLIESTGSSVHIRMITNKKYQGKGFRLRYVSNCNVTLTDYFGVIESLNYPNAYPENTVCQWIIKAPIGGSVNIEFESFYIQFNYDDVNCLINYLLVTTEDERLHTKKSDESFGPFCREISNKITAANNLVKIT